MRNLLLSAALILPLAACGPSKPPAPLAKAPPPAAPASPPIAADPRAADLDRINKASFDPSAAPAPAQAVATPTDKTAAPDPLLIRAEVLLDRARFSPGVVDGKLGTNLKHAVMAYQSAHSLTPSGGLDADTWKALSADHGCPPQPGPRRWSTRSPRTTSPAPSPPMWARTS